MASPAITTRVFVLQSLLYILVIFVVRIVASVQTEKCLPQVDKLKYWSQVGGRFEVNCTLINCDNKFERQTWNRNGRRFRNFRSNQVYFSESKRLKLLIDPVEESDKGEYSCHTQILDHYQNVKLIIGVEPTTATTTTTPAPTTTTTTTPAPTTATAMTSPTSTTAKSASFSSTATATLKVITSSVKIIKTTKMPLDFTSKTILTPATNHSRKLLNSLSIWASILLLIIQAFVC